MNNKKFLQALPSYREINYFRGKLIKWFCGNERSYPWRETSDPFKILIAEIMLRRTKADQVKPVYENLFNKYPDIESLANASENDLSQLLAPLGLKWRNSTFHLIASELKNKYNCRVPDKRESLKELPGVGEYVAGAVLSITYGKKEWIVDSNIVRIFKRYFGIKIIGEGRRKKSIIEIAKVYILCKNPRIANLAILDFAALVCTPRKLLCEECILRKKCKINI